MVWQQGSGSGVSGQSSPSGSGHEHAGRQGYRRVPSHTAAPQVKTQEDTQC
jgi:hypothetical protein